MERPISSNQGWDDCGLSGIFRGGNQRCRGTWWLRTCRRHICLQSFHLSPRLLLHTSRHELNTHYHDSLKTCNLIAIHSISSWVSLILNGSFEVTLWWYVCFQVSLAIAAVLAVVLYRMSVLAALAMQGESYINSYALLFTTSTAATINLCCIMLFNWVSVSLLHVLFWPVESEEISWKNWVEIEGCY